MSKNQPTAAAPAAAKTPIAAEDAVQTAAPAAAELPEVAGVLVKARVLVAGAYGKPNDVVEVLAAEAEASGELDAHPDAVAYAESLNA